MLDELIERARQAGWSDREIAWLASAPTDRWWPLLTANERRRILKDSRGGGECW